MDHMEYFGKTLCGSPKAGARGAESEWIDVGEVNVPQGLLWAGDPQVIRAEEGCTVEAPPGQYKFQIKGMDFDGVRVLSRARVIAKSARKFALGPRVGEAGTDVAQIAICDVRALNEGVGTKNLDEFVQDIAEQISEGPSIANTEFAYGKKSIEIVFAPSGFGDGGYDVYVLRSGDKTVGLEVEFLPSGYVVE